MPYQINHPQPDAAGVPNAHRSPRRDCPAGVPDSALGAPSRRKRQLTVRDNPGLGSMTTAAEIRYSPTRHVVGDPVGTKTDVPKPLRAVFGARHSVRASLPRVWINPCVRSASAVIWFQVSSGRSAVSMLGTRMVWTVRRARWRRSTVRRCGRAGRARARRRHTSPIPRAGWSVRRLRSGRLSCGADRSRFGCALEDAAWWFEAAYSAGGVEDTFGEVGVGLRGDDQDVDVFTARGVRRCEQRRVLPAVTAKAGARPARQPACEVASVTLSVRARHGHRARLRGAAGSFAVAGLVSCGSAPCGVRWLGSPRRCASSSGSGAVA